MERGLRVGDAAECPIVHSGRRSAPAKINLTLEVLHKRPDGFHALRSVVAPIALYDELSWTSAEAFTFTCSDARLSGDDNLVVKAAKAIGLDTQPVALHLDKFIPYGSGLGGGSSDAAALLLAAMHGAFGPQPDRDWLAIGRAIGSDVPLFFVDAPALIEATGERVTALGENPRWWAVLLFPNVEISTRTAYARLDSDPRRISATSRTQSISIQMVEALQRKSFARVGQLLSNDFESTVFENDIIADGIQAFSRLRIKAHLSGSGSTLFALWENEEAAHQCATALRDDPAIIKHQMQIRAVEFAQSTAWRSAS